MFSIIIGLILFINILLITIVLCTVLYHSKGKAIPKQNNKAREKKNFFLLSPTIKVNQKYMNQHKYLNWFM